MDRPFLVGEKIYLRPFDEDDLEGDYVQWVNDREIIKHLASNAFPKTRDELKNYVTQVANSPDYIFLAVMEKSTEKHVGNAKLGPKVSIISP